MHATIRVLVVMAKVHTALTLTVTLLSSLNIMKTKKTFNSHNDKDGSLAVAYYHIDESGHL